MCNHSISNTNAHNVDVSDFIQENVLDIEGFKQETKCPNCENTAYQRDFDECLGGSINSVYSIDCPHCGHHECDQEVCNQCEVIYEQKYAAQSRNLDEAVEADLMLESMIESLEKDGRIDPVTLTQLKLKLTSNTDVEQHFELVFVPRGTKANQYIKRKLLDANFCQKIERKIELAKEELA